MLNTAALKVYLYVFEQVDEFKYSGVNIITKNNMHNEIQLKISNANILSIYRLAIFNILKEFKLPKKLINLIKATMENSEIKIKIANSTSQSFKVTSDLK